MMSEIFCRVKPKNVHNHPQTRGTIYAIVHTPFYIQTQNSQNARVWPAHFVNSAAICYVLFDEEVKAHPDSDKYFKTLAVPIEDLERAD